MNNVLAAFLVVAGVGTLILTHWSAFNQGRWSALRQCNDFIFTRWSRSNDHLVEFAVDMVFAVFRKEIGSNE